MRDQATQRQVDAARPDASTWLSANAGSGKTRVLTDRVARLLFDGVSPQHILCLTYTKAAASEMQNRLFQRLGEWTMLPDNRLIEELMTLGVEGALTPEHLGKARTLFARAIETPGGLKIQTIHSFCASLLRRFPLEAGVSPQFQEIDERTAKLLQNSVLEHLALARDPSAIDALTRYHTGHEVERFLWDVLKHKAALSKPTTDDDIYGWFGVPAGQTATALAASAFAFGDEAVLDELRGHCATSGVNDQKLALLIGGLNIKNPTLADLHALEKSLLTGVKAKDPFSAKIGSVPTKKIQQTCAHLMPAFEALMQRVEDLRSERHSFEAAQKTQALYRFAGVFLPEYEARKLAQGWLDFDDLIEKARALLTDPRVAQWVLFRLDGGIDHILVDEAQDTSPVQWDVIRLLAGEFTAGEGAREEMRTIFVVGDKKQSIYSFQGADPKAFDEMREQFSTGLEDVDQTLQTMELQHSFRSSSAILDTVDQVFSSNAEAALGQASTHIAFKSSLPGRVEVWPAIEALKTESDKRWFDPVDLLGDDHHTPRLARAIAQRIRKMIDTEMRPVQGRDGQVTMQPIKAGDVLILLQRRSELFHEVIRACKVEVLPIAGADRLKIGAELAVRDIKAFLSFLATPEDDLSLASVLKSPLFGWSEDDLFRLAHGRKGYLWAALRSDGAQHPETMSIIDELRRVTDFLRPFDLIERILNRFDGRKKLLGRLGTEAEEGLDALLAQALAFEKASVPSLTGFLTWLDAEEVEVKRQIDNSSDEVRVMTIHGSKGLEAPIVFLPDTTVRKPPTAPAILVRDERAIWLTSKGDAPQLQRAWDGDREVAQEKERMRLLYVAMTRAETWLITCAAGDVGENTDSWHSRVTGALTDLGAEPLETPTGTGLRFEPLPWVGDLPEKDTTSPKIAPQLPDWTKFQSAKVVLDQGVISPSKLAGPKALPGDYSDEDTNVAMARGTALHQLLEVLPLMEPASWDTAATRILAGFSDAIDKPSLISEAIVILKDPNLAGLFTASALVETEVTGTSPDGQPIFGAIDRLIVTADSVLAIDYKSNLIIPPSPEKTPSGILAQMGAYAHVLGQIYPSHKINVAILWTRTPQLMQIPQHLVSDAFQNAMSA